MPVASDAIDLCSIQFVNIAQLCEALADAGINLRGISAAALGRRSVTYFAFDSGADADTAIRVLKKALK